MEATTIASHSWTEWERMQAAGQRDFDRGDYQGAERHWLAAVREGQKADPADPRVARSLHALGRAYTRMGRHEPAETLHRRALDIYRAACGEESTDVADSLAALAGCAWRRGDLAAAEPMARRALEIRRRANPDSPLVIESMENVAILAAERGDFAISEPLFAQVLSAHERVFGGRSEKLAASLTNIGHFYLKAGKNIEALNALLRARQIQESIFPPEHPAHAGTLFDLGEALARQGQLTEARTAIERSLAIRERTVGANHQDLIGPLCAIAKLHQHARDPAAAESVFFRALSIAERHLPPTSGLVGELLAYYGESLLFQKQNARAEPYLRRGVAILEASMGDEHWLTLCARVQLATACCRLGALDEAEPLLRKAMATLANRPGLAPPEGVADLLDYSAEVFGLLGYEDEAAALLARAAEILRQKAGGEQDAGPATYYEPDGP